MKSWCIKVFEPVRIYENLTEGVVNQLLKHIDTGELKPGDRLPPERDLAGMFSVSRTVIRDALKTLVGLGMVTIKHGTGAFINPLAEQGEVSRLASYLKISKGTIDELFQVRQVLETEAVVWCSERATEEDIRELEAIIKRAKEVNPGNENRFGVLDAEFHLKICEAGGNTVLMRLMINLLDLLGEIRTRTLLVPGLQKRSVAEHATIIEAIKMREPELARKRMQRHLEEVQKSISRIDAPEGEWDNESQD